MDVNFKHGLKTNLPTATSPGTLYITSDTGEAYVDFEDSRTQIFDSTKFPVEGGNMEGDINMQMHKVYNISEPENIVNDLYLTNIYVVPQQPNYTYYEGSVAVNNQAGNVGINICNLNNNPQTVSSSSITLISNT